MAGCGYVCPQCEGRGVMDSGEPCDYCQPQTEKSSDSTQEENPDNGEKD